MKLKVFQIQHDTDHRNLLFMDYERAMANGGVKPEEYKCVFNGYITAYNLEDLFTICNRLYERPPTYRGHSMTTSDVVVMEDEIQPDWTAFGTSDEGKAFTQAAILVYEATMEVCNKDIDHMHGMYVDGLSDDSNSNRTMLYFHRKDRSDVPVDELKPFIMPIIRERANIIPSSILEQYGWTPRNLELCIAERIANPVLKEYATQAVLADDYTIDTKAQEIVDEVSRVRSSAGTGKVPEHKYVPYVEKGAYFCDSFGFKKIDFDPSLAQEADGLRVLEIRPCKPPFETRVPDTLESWQKAVSKFGEPSLMEVTYPFDDNAVVVGNEEAKLNGMRGNRRLEGDVYCGQIFIVGDNNGEFCDLTDDQIKKYSDMFAEPEDISDEEILNATGFSIMGFN